MIVTVTGDKGSGKTSLLSFFGLLAHRSGISVLSNYDFAFGNRMSSLNDLVRFQGLVLFDEGQSSADSRNFARDSVKYFTQLLMYTRKLNIVVMFSSIRDSYLDVRLRDMSDIAVWAEATHDSFVYHFGTASRHLGSYAVDPTTLLKILDGAFNTNEFVKPVHMPTSQDEFNALLTLLEESLSAH